jgi:hypothetical protein
MMWQFTAWSGLSHGGIWESSNGGIIVKRGETEETRRRTCTIGTSPTTDLWCAYEVWISVSNAVLHLFRMQKNQTQKLLTFSEIKNLLYSLFVYGLCNDSFSRSGYIASNYFGWLRKINFTRVLIRPGYCPSVHLDRLKKITENLSHNGSTQLGRSML